MNIISFFQLSAGRWHSCRMTHHLAFKASEMGDSKIVVDYLVADHPAIVELCTFHEIAPHLSIGGSRVHWQGKMQWDREDDDNHEGETIFAIVPDVDTLRRGRLLRDRGYAEIMPVVGRYELNDENRLLLTTQYEMMSVTEQIWFDNPNLRLRTSVVKLYGGFSTAALCTETRIEGASEPDFQVAGVSELPVTPSQDTLQERQSVSVLGW
ncbi:MAG: phycobiliprotein lyase [Cyanobacteria bacterium CRU_2_1]|nr:phycobiliprotein lyase [Cyanobacteria bacterium RU_5_0]NJR61554.1 phycobiliprotein lyase [Cyanobacteria bacterium CRU_2_1]